MAKILQFIRPKTKEYHDTMRQISRSQTPSGLRDFLDTVKDIHMSASRPRTLWFHYCEGRNGKGTDVEIDMICPHCHRDMYGNKR